MQFLNNHNPDDFSRCPIKERVFEGLTNGERIHNVADSIACATKCVEKSSCLYWSWLTSGMCELNEGFTSEVYNEHGVSGDYTCDGDPAGDQDWVTCITDVNVDPTKVREVCITEIDISK